MKIENISKINNIITIKCSGKILKGSESNGYFLSILENIDRNINEKIKEIILDFTDVEYISGDAAISVFTKYLYKNKLHLTYIATGKTFLNLKSIIDDKSFNFLNLFSIKKNFLNKMAEQLI